MEPLCLACRSINLHEIARTKLPERMNGANLAFWTVEELDKTGYNHIKNAQDLFISAKSCKLCSLMLRVANDLFILRVRSSQLDGRHEFTKDSLLPLPIKFASPEAYVVPSDGGLGLHTLIIAMPFAVSHFQASYFHPYIRAPLIGVLAREDTPAALRGDVFGRPHLPSVDCSQAHAWLREKLDQCINNHVRCHLGMAGDNVEEASGVQLPRRLLDVGEKDDTSVRLVLSNGRTGKYATLSHCWGPKEMQPVRTLTGNLNQFLTDIPADILSNSKTFQDAITVTREVGLRYLWIDSLCIVQDDNTDWKQEAAMMGEIYQNSHLTIIAAYAENGRAGCFYDRSLLQSPPIVHVPYIDKHGSVSGTMQIKAKLIDYSIQSHPINCPTSDRAWITQEERLSRRKIYYTKQSMFWACRELEIYETNETSPFEPKEWVWKQIVKDYTVRKLTFQADKLVALQGLAGVMQKCRTQDRYHVGLWLKDLPDDLLWFGQREQLESITDSAIPSWSWASRKGPVSFLEFDPFNTYQHERYSVSLDEHNNLTLNCPIFPIVYAKDPTAVKSWTREEAMGTKILGSITPWPLGIRDILITFREKSGIRFHPMFEWLANQLQSARSPLFGFSVHRTYIVTDLLKVAMGYATLDDANRERSTDEEIYHCAVVRKGGKTNEDQRRFYYVLLLQDESQKMVGNPDLENLTRVGVGIIISNWMDDLRSMRFRIR